MDILESEIESFENASTARICQTADKLIQEKLIRVFFEPSGGRLKSQYAPHDLRRAVSVMMQEYRSSMGEETGHSYNVTALMGTTILVEREEGIDALEQFTDLMTNVSRFQANPTAYSAESRKTLLSVALSNFVNIVKNMVGLTEGSGVMFSDMVFHSFNVLKLLSPVPLQPSVMIATQIREVLQRSSAIQGTRYRNKTIFWDSWVELPADDELLSDQMFTNDPDVLYERNIWTNRAFHYKKVGNTFLRKAQEIIYSKEGQTLSKQREIFDALNEAIRYYTEGLTSSNDDVSNRIALLNNRAYCYLYKEEWVNCETDAKESLLLKNDPKMRYRCAVALHGQGKYEEALDELDKATDVDDLINKDFATLRAKIFKACTYLLNRPAKYSRVGITSTRTTPTTTIATKRPTKVLVVPSMYGIIHRPFTVRASFALSPDGTLTIQPNNIYRSSYSARFEPTLLSEYTETNIKYQRLMARWECSQRIEFFMYKRNLPALLYAAKLTTYFQNRTEMITQAELKKFRNIITRFTDTTTLGAFIVPQGTSSPDMIPDRTLITKASCFGNPTFYETFLKKIRDRKAKAYVFNYCKYINDAIAICDNDYEILQCVVPAAKKDLVEFYRRYSLGLDDESFRKNVSQNEIRTFGMSLADSIVNAGRVLHDTEVTVRGELDVMKNACEQEIADTMAKLRVDATNANLKRRFRELVVVKQAYVTLNRISTENDYLSLYDFFTSKKKAFKKYQEERAEMEASVRTDFKPSAETQIGIVSAIESDETVTHHPDTPVENDELVNAMNIISTAGTVTIEETEPEGAAESAGAAESHGTEEEEKTVESQTTTESSEFQTTKEETSARSVRRTGCPPEVVQIRKNIQRLKQNSFYRGGVEGYKQTQSCGPTLDHLVGTYRNKSKHSFLSRLRRCIYQRVVYQLELDCYDVQRFVELIVQDMGTTFADKTTLIGEAKVLDKLRLANLVHGNETIKTANDKLIRYIRHTGVIYSLLLLHFLVSNMPQRIVSIVTKDLTSELRPDILFPFRKSKSSGASSSSSSSFQQSSDSISTFGYMDYLMRNTFNHFYQRTFVVTYIVDEATRKTATLNTSYHPFMPHVCRKFVTYVSKSFGQHTRLEHIHAVIATGFNRKVKSIVTHLATHAADRIPLTGDNEDDTHQNVNSLHGLMSGRVLAQALLKSYNTLKPNANHAVEFLPTRDKPVDQTQPSFNEGDDRFYAFPLVLNWFDGELCCNYMRHLIVRDDISGITANVLNDVYDLNTFNDATFSDTSKAFQVQ